MVDFNTKQVADRLGLSALEVRNCIIWGNHSSTQFPDVRHAHAFIKGEKVAVPEAVKDDHWLKNEFISVSLRLRCVNKWLWREVGG